MLSSIRRRTNDDDIHFKHGKTQASFNLSSDGGGGGLGNFRGFQALRRPFKFRNLTIFFKEIHFSFVVLADLEKGG